MLSFFGLLLPGLLFVAGIARVASAQVFNPPTSVSTGGAPLSLSAGTIQGSPSGVIVYSEKLVGGSIPQVNSGVVFGAVNGTFSAPSHDTVGFPRAYDTVTAVADFTGDGLPDYLFGVSRAINGDAPVCIAPTSAGGHFAAGVGVPCNNDTAIPITGSAVADFTSIAAAPLVTGGAPWVLLEDQANAAVYVVRYTGVTGSLFSLASKFSLTADGPGPMAALDTDADGNTDIVILSLSTHVVTVYRGHGDGTFTALSPYTLPGGIFSMLVQDIDGDGHPDLIVEGVGGALSVFMGSGSGFSRSAAPLAGAQDASTGHGGHLVGLADLDGDGVLDLVTYTPAGISVLLGHAGLSYTLDRMYPTGLSSGFTPTMFLMADFTGDGHQDVGMNSPTGITILVGKGNVRAVTGTLAASPEPSQYGQDFTLTATLTAPSGGAAPTGTVNFLVDGVAAGSGTLAGGVATYTVSAPTYVRGVHTLTAQYGGDTNYDPLTLTGSHTVTGLRSQTTFTITTPTIFYGQVADGVGSVSAVDTGLNVDVYGGTITFYDGAINICVVPVTAARSSCPPSAGAGFNVGVHILTAVYSGNSFFDPSSSVPGTVTVFPDDTAGTPASSLNPAFAGQAVTLSATFTAPYATPVGPVTFLDGATPIGTAALDASGVASITTSTLAVGTHNITAVLASTLNFNGSATAILVQVILPPLVPPTPTTTMLTSSLNPSVLGQSVTFSATVALTGAVGIPTGAVSFAIDGLAVGTVALNVSGIASLTTSTLTLGSHTVVASYAGTATIAASTSATLIQQVNAPYVGPGDFQLTVASSDLSVPIGSSAAVLVTITPLNGFNQPVTLSCAGLVAQSTCTFGTATIPPGGGSTLLFVYAAAPHTCGTNDGYFVTSSGPSTWLGLLAGTALICLVRRRRVLQGIALAVALCVLPAMTGCGNCTDLGVRPGSYSFVLTGTSTGSPTIAKSLPMKMAAHL
jgi:hypothetical protein